MKTHIPRTDSIDEMARFWDSHDVTDFEDELEEMSQPVFERHPKPHVTIALDSEELSRIKRMAASRGLAEEVLIQQWVREKLGQS